MKSSICPLSAVPQDLVIEYLASRDISPQRAAWKYFDKSFNQGRERGFVWYSKGRVKGFIGVIPCILSTPDGDREMVWTCDWSIENPLASPGMGILLLKKVRSEYSLVAGIGGTKDTHASVPLMNTRTIADTACTFHLPLRLGAFLEKAESKLRFLPTLSQTLLGAIPVRRRTHTDAHEVTIEAGVLPGLTPLFDRPAMGPCRTRYDHSYIDWQVGRCPGVTSTSFLISALGSPAAGAVIWSQGSDPRHWRAVFRSAPGTAALLRPLIETVAAWVEREGGVLLSTMVSHLDAETISALRKAHFLEGQERQPLYITHEEATAEEGFADLSYLDTDLACLF